MDGSSLAVRRIQADQVDAFRRIRLEALRSEPTFYASSYEDWVVGFHAELSRLGR